MYKATFIQVKELTYYFNICTIYLKRMKSLYTAEEVKKQNQKVCNLIFLNLFFQQ